MSEEFTTATRIALDQLGQALLEQLDPDSDAPWSLVELRARREDEPPERVLKELGPAQEYFKMSLSVTVEGIAYPKIPRPNALAACRELDRVSTTEGHPRWRGVRFQLSRNPDGAPRYQCWWEYDSPARTGS
jgi:hypothetical protein